MQSVEADFCINAGGLRMVAYRFLFILDVSF
jgi:hypothetical protein